MNSVETGGVEKYLILQEYGPLMESEVLQNKKKMESCDLICLVYDSTDTNSFAYIANLRVFIFKSNDRKNIRLTIYL